MRYSRPQTGRTSDTFGRNDGGTGASRRFTRVATIRALPKWTKSPAAENPTAMTSGPMLIPATAVGCRPCEQLSEEAIGSPNSRPQARIPAVARVWRLKPCSLRPEGASGMASCSGPYAGAGRPPPKRLPPAAERDRAGIREGVAPATRHPAMPPVTLGRQSQRAGTLSPGCGSDRFSRHRPRDAV